MGRMASGERRSACPRDNGPADDGLGEGVPRRLAGGDEVVEAGGEVVRGPVGEPAEDLGRDVGEERSRGGRADLVRDDVQAVPLRREAEDRLHEVLPDRAEDPARPEGEVLRAARREGFLSVPLRGPVDAHGGGAVTFLVGCELRAVEDVVGRVVDDAGSEAARGLAQDSGSDRVDGAGTIRLGFGPVDRGVGRRVDDDPGAGLLDDAADRDGVREVAVGIVDGDDLAEGSQGPLELEADLSALSDEENPHLLHRSA